jgi:hypothetical protein
MMVSNDRVLSTVVAAAAVTGSGGEAPEGPHALWCEVLRRQREIEREKERQRDRRRDGRERDRRREGRKRAERERERDVHGDDEENNHQTDDFKEKSRRLFWVRQ